MFCKLGSIVLREGSAHFRWQRRKPVCKVSGNAIGFLVGLQGDEDEPRNPLLRHQKIVLFVAEHHQIGLPMACLLAFVNAGWSFFNPDAVLDMQLRSTTFSPSIASFELGAGQVKSPAKIIRPTDLRIKKTIDGLVADNRLTLFASQSACNLFGRPSHCKTVQYEHSQVRLAFKPRALPAPRPRKFIRIGRAIYRLRACAHIALYLSRNCRCRAIQS